MSEKIFKSYAQQLDILRARGMHIENDSYATHILERENYYNVINGYKDLFLVSKATVSKAETYKTGTSFDEVFALYNFDREIRNIYFKYLLKIETMFKSVIAYEFSSQYGHDNYLKIENFDTSTERGISSAIKLIGDIQQETARQMNKHHQAVTHYLTRHGYIPLWVLINVLTFGKIEYFYKNMRPSDQVAVSRRFYLQPNEFAKFMHMLALARNKCAHDERFFDIRFKERIHTKSIKNFSALGIVRAKDGSYIRGTNDAYAISIIFALILDKSDIGDFVFSMNSCFEKLQGRLHTISIEDVASVMGYPADWRNLSQLTKGNDD